MICSNCGREIRDHSTFCIYCGAVVTPGTKDNAQDRKNNEKPASHLPDQDLDEDFLSERSAENTNDLESRAVDGENRDFLGGRSVAPENPQGNTGDSTKKTQDGHASIIKEALEEPPQEKDLYDYDAPEQTRTWNRSMVRKILTILLIILLAAAAIGVGVYAHSYFTREKIDVSGNLKFRSGAIEGFSGEAKVTEDPIYEIKEPKTVKQSESGAFSASEKEREWGNFQYSLYTSCSKRKNLANGDQIDAAVKSHYSRRQIRRLESRLHIRIVGLNKSRSFTVKNLDERYADGQEAEKKGAEFISNAKKVLAKDMQDSYGSFSDYESASLYSSYFARAKGKDKADYLVLIYKMKTDPDSYYDEDDENSDTSKTKYMRVLVGPFNSSVTDFTYNDADIEQESDTSLTASLEPKAEAYTMYYYEFDSPDKAVSDLTDSSEYNVKYELYSIK